MKKKLIEAEDKYLSHDRDYHKISRKLDLPPSGYYDLARDCYREAWEKFKKGIKKIIFN